MNSEGSGGYWEKDDGSDSGTWAYVDGELETKGRWVNEASTVEGFWTSNEAHLMVRYATA